MVKLARPEYMGALNQAPIRLVTYSSTRLHRLLTFHWLNEELMAEAKEGDCRTWPRFDHVVKGCASTTIALAILLLERQC